MGNIDDQRGRIERVAGVSLRAPQEGYRVAGLSFGEAVLSRDAGGGRWASLTLLVAPGAAPKGPVGSGAEATRVTFPMLSALTAREAPTDLAYSLHGLLIEDELLSKPEWLTDPTPSAPPADAGARSAVARLRAVLTKTIQWPARCPACAPPPSASARRFGYEGHGSSQFQSMLRMFGLGGLGLDEDDDRPAPDCVHTPMRHEALRALCGAHAELAFEGAMLLVAAPKLSPPRFVLNPVLMSPLLGAWLMEREGMIADRPIGRARDAVGAPPPTPAVGAALSPAPTDALAVSARAWGFHGPSQHLAAQASDGATPVLGKRFAPPEVTLRWPEGVARPAPRPVAEAAPPKEKPKRATARRVGRAGAVSAPTVVETGAPIASPVAGQEMLTAELRALGYTDAKVKRLIADGALERAGYGWFRWKVAPVRDGGG